MDQSRYIEKTYVGSGGMASVYKAFDKTLQRHIAIKEMTEQFLENESVRNLFLGEARKMASVRHQNVVQVYDIIDDSPIPTILMEYMSGGSLATRMGTDPLPTEVVLRIVRQVAQGLQAIHDVGLVHRDVKPENILEEGGNYKITDFGVAVDGEEDAVPFVTNKYAAPEVLIDPHQISAASDLYSLGIMAVEMILGPREFELAVREAIEQDDELQLPSIKDSAQAFWQRWVASSVELPMLSDIDSAVPEEVAQFLANATKRKKTERFVDCRSFIKGLDKAIEVGGQRASAPTDYDPKLKRKLDKSKAEKNAAAGVKKKRPLWFKLVVGLGVTVIAGIAALFLMPPPVPIYLFDVVTNPAGASVAVNGVAVEDAATPTQISASFGDIVTLRSGDQDPVELPLAEGMQGLTVGDASYILEVSFAPPFSIESSEQAAAYLMENLPQSWPADASIPGIDGTGVIEIPLGTPMSFNVTSNKAAALTLMYLTADNYAIVIYPAPNGLAPTLEEGVMANVGEELRLVAKEPLGEEWIFFALADGMPALPEIEGGINLDDTMVAYQIAGAGSPGQEIVVWLSSAVGQLEASSTYLEVEIVPGTESQ